MMKKTGKKVLLGIGMCALTVGGVLLYEIFSTTLRVPLQETPASQVESSASVPAESVEQEINDLLQGDETLSDSEVEKIVEEIAAEEAASTSESAAEEPKPESTAQSPAESRPSSVAASAAEPPASTSTASSSSTSSTASSSQTQEDSCDEQIKVLVAQLYQQQERYERELLETIRQAHEEYIAYPEEQRSLVLKVQVVLGKTSDLTKMEKECDAEVEKICTQMTTILEANGRDTALVQEVKKTYQDKKSELKKELVRQTYSGGDGSGSAGHWLYDQLEK